MKWTISIVAFLLLSISSAQQTGSQPASSGPSETSQSPSRNKDKAALIERGRYLAHHVAMCVQCHTPRDENGELIEGELFQGAPVPVKEPVFSKNWAFRAPDIAGLPGYPIEAEIRLLTTGIGRDGVPPRPPMPPFRMSKQDVEAIATYLKSLK